MISAPRYNLLNEAADAIEKGNFTSFIAVCKYNATVEDLDFLIRLLKKAATAAPSHLRQQAVAACGR